MVTGGRSAETPLLLQGEGPVEWHAGDVAENELLVAWQRLPGLAVRQSFADFVSCFPLGWYVVLAVRRLQYIRFLCVVAQNKEVWRPPVGLVY